MAYKDIRAWLDELEKQGELLRIRKEVDWNLEVGAVSRKVYDTGAPAPLFENIKGYPGFRILGAPIGLSARNRFARVAIALDMPPNSNVRDITAEYLRRRRNPIDPVHVSDAPCQEHVLLGDDIDLLKFPVPMIHADDGGRYFGTWHTVVTRDPDDKWVNYGMYRMCVVGKNKLAGVIGNRQHITQFWRKCKARGERLEFAAVFGTEPVTALISATTLADGVSEPHVIGGLRGAPLELVKCKTVDLHVPAGAEIVLEGYMDPNEMAMEGPFGEYPGYNAGGREPRPVYTVTAITYRSNPILPMSSLGVPVDDSHVVLCLTIGAEILEELRDQRGLPVSYVYLPPEGVSHLAVVATKEVPNKSYIKQLGMALWATKGGGTYCNHIIVVNDDIDPTDMKQVIWALATRCHPYRGIWKIDHTYVTVLIPWTTPTERSLNDGAAVLYDCTWPVEWPKDWIPTVGSFTEAWPADMQQRVLANWADYGFTEK